MPDKAETRCAVAHAENRSTRLTRVSTANKDVIPKKRCAFLGKKHEKLLAKSPRLHPTPAGVTSSSRGVEDPRSTATNAPRP